MVWTAGGLDSDACCVKRYLFRSRHKDIKRANNLIEKRLSAAGSAALQQTAEMEAKRKANDVVEGA